VQPLPEHHTHARKSSLPVVPNKVHRQPPIPHQPPPPVPQRFIPQAQPYLPTQPQARARSNSPASRQQPNRLQPRRVSPSPAPRGRSSSAQPLATGNETHQMATTPGGSPRPESLNSSNGSPPRAAEKGKLRRSWLPGGRSRGNSHDAGKNHPSLAWIISAENRVDYNVAYLIKGEKVCITWTHLLPLLHC
jgi:hypothetical protein